MTPSDGPALPAARFRFRGGHGARQHDACVRAVRVVVRKKAGADPDRAPSDRVGPTVDRRVVAAGADGRDDDPPERKRHA